MDFNKKIKISGIICGVSFVVGLILFIMNFEYIKYSDAFAMIGACSALEDSICLRLIRRGNISLAGFGISVISLIAFVVLYLVFSRMRSKFLLKKQVEESENANYDILSSEKKIE